MSRSAPVRRRRRILVAGEAIRWSVGRRRSGAMREDRAVELAQRGHAAMADRFRIGAQIDGGEAMEEAGAAIWAFRSELPAMMNGAVRVDGGDAHAALEAARAYFAGRRRGF